jgi:hypothetical protein
VNRSPFRATAHTLERTSPPTFTSVVAEARMSCFVLSSRAYSRKYSVVSP